MRIDVHTHYWTDAYLDMLVDVGRFDTATSAASAQEAAPNSTPGCG